jgi:hypothetical protein
LRLSPVPLTACCPSPSEQHDGPDGKLSEEVRLNASRPRQRRIGLLPSMDRALLRTKPEQVRPVRFESLLHEDPRRVLLPRWTAPPEPDEHA